MKNIIFLILSLLVALSFSCQNDIDDDMENDIDLSSEVDNSISDTFLTLDHIKGYIPNQILEGKSIVFESATGKEITLRTELTEKIFGGTVDGQQYEYENIIIGLQDEESVLQITIIGNSTYGNGGNSNVVKFESLNINLMPSFPDARTTGEIVLDEEGNFSSSNSRETPQTVTINGESYEDTFHFEGDNPDRFSELFYQTDIGILGFRTFNNTLYVFKEFVD